MKQERKYHAVHFRLMRRRPELSGRIPGSVGAATADSIAACVCVALTVASPENLAHSPKAAVTSLLPLDQCSPKHFDPVASAFNFIDEKFIEASARRLVRH